jgi:gamma-glutamyltranspeptidase/glutathione hydrolase
MDAIHTTDVTVIRPNDPVDLVAGRWRRSEVAEPRPRAGVCLALCALSLLASACAGGDTGPARTEAIPAADSQPLTDGRMAHRPVVPGVQGLVTAGHPLASMAGMQVLMQGGTAADAAVAVLATLSQVEPMMSGPGGNGFMTVYDAETRRVYSLNATGAAPAALDAADIPPEELHRGMTAGVVPGMFGGWVALLERFGTMTLGQVLRPAIDYAEQGHPIDPFVVRSLTRSRKLIERYPSTASALLIDGELPVAGQLVTYPDLARTFHKLIEAEDTARLDRRGREAGLQAAFTRFYRGDMARDMVRFYERNGGLFTRADFAAYEPTWSEPVHTTYRGYDVYSSPVTSRGGLELAMQLNLVEGFDVAALGHNSAQTLHLIAESIKVAKSDVYHFVADPAHAEVPVAGMTSKSFADTRRRLISSDAVLDYPDHGEPPGTTVTHSRRPNTRVASAAAERTYPGSTASFSVVDRSGNVVVATPTLGSLWGTGVVVGDTGLIFNNGTRVGSTSPYPEDVNYARGGQIPILNNAPTLIMRDGELFLALGTPGGETIGQTQFQMVLNVIDFGLSVQEAVEAPRLALVADPNFYKPRAAMTVQVEQRIAPAVLRQLQELGHTVEAVGEYTIGSMQGIFRDPDTGTIVAGADPRRMMYAVGW